MKTIHVPFVIQYSLYLILISTSFSCKHGKPVTQTDVTRSRDSLEMSNTIHQFYKWYHGIISDTIQDFNFVDDSGDRYKLKRELLKIYLDKLNSSGHLSNSFIAREEAFYLECEKLWQDEIVGEVPSCMDGDHFFCAQEWDMDFWTNSPIVLDVLDSDSAQVRMVGKSFGLELERKFKLVREVGIWKLDFIECDMGF
ncbi:MAG: DUF3828 domain-containing protein [Saprospiraceae bacterium]|nr:DUF3828 domain-containing protein [Saprospiraceae bacterium]